jgi:hypothetical protein
MHGFIEIRPGFVINIIQVKTVECKQGRYILRLSDLMQETVTKQSNPEAYEQIKKHVGA